MSFRCVLFPSFVITMSFRATVGDGIIFYIANSNTNPTQYVSLEMVSGRLRYEFFTGKGKVTIETGNVTRYGGHGNWYKVISYAQFFFFFLFTTKLSLAKRDSVRP